MLSRLEQVEILRRYVLADACLWSGVLPPAAFSVFTRCRRPFAACGALVYGVSRVRGPNGFEQKHRHFNREPWPAPGSEDTELGVLMEPEVCHGATEVYASSSLRLFG